MATTGNYLTEVFTYERAACVFQTDGDRVRWGEALYGTDGAEQAALDFAGIAVQGIDPVAEGWEMVDFESADEAQRYYDKWVWGWTLVASTGMYQGRDTDMLAHADPEEWGDQMARVFTRTFIGK